MTIQLTVIAGPDKGRSFPLQPGTPLLVGRSKDTQTKLADPSASRVHCQVLFEGDHVVVQDRQSAAGTWVNGKRITQHQLRPGDVIRVGDTQLRFETGNLAEQSTLGPTPP